MLTIPPAERRLAGRLIAVCCLLLFFYLALSTALTMTPTSDEPAHIIRGITLSQLGDLRFQIGHAPFSHRLIGSLLFSEEQLPQVDALASWGSGDRLEIAAELLWDSGINVDRLLLLARLPIIWIGVLLGGLVASWALSWQGKLAMVVALVFFASSPNLIAHASLATTDLLTTATYFATVYAWWRTWQKGGRKWWLLTAVFLGLALATKLTAILLIPVLFLQAFLYAGRGRGFWRPLWVSLGLLPLSGLVLWLVYGFETGPFASWPAPVPAPSYLSSWQEVLTHVGAGHRSFFWGNLSKEGWWFYFPAAFLIKTPLMTLLLLLVAAWVVIRRRALWRTAAFLLIPVGALFAAAIVSKLNIGYRHILPALPLLLVFGCTSVLLLRRRRATRILLGLGLAWSLIIILIQHPHHLAFFNTAVGGMAQGYRYLGDSNLDWGQDLKLLVETVTGEEGPWLTSFYGVSDPDYYGLPQGSRFDWEGAWGAFALANPPAGRYAISTNHLQGLMSDADLFDWFRRQQPAYTLGGSIQVFEVQEQASGEWIAQCLDPLPLLAAEEAETLVGSSGLRHLFFDCQQSFVLAEEGRPGWFVLPQADNWWFEDQLALDDLQLVFRHDAAEGRPSFDVFYWPGTDDWSLSPAWVQTAADDEGNTLALPHAVDDIVQLVGYKQDGDQWFTLWQAAAQADQPLSLKAHLIINESGIPLVGDSLGFSSDQWREGDWLLQRHRFPGQTDGQYLQTGLYNFQTLETVGELLNLPTNNES